MKEREGDTVVVVVHPYIGAITPVSQWKCVCRCCLEASRERISTTHKVDGNRNGREKCDYYCKFPSLATGGVDTQA